jgi:Mor family transcriptional regulator
MGGNLVTVPPVALDKHTAKQLRKAADDVAEATQRRNHWILEAHGYGASLREIAEHAGISHVAVLKIIRRDKP